MNVFEVSDRVGDSGEHILGAQETGSHACYLIYGRMDKGEKDRVLKPGKGHEEILLAVKGVFRVTGDQEGTLREGQALHLRGEETYRLENRSEETAIYVLAGGHSGGHGHQ